MNTRMHPRMMNRQDLARRARDFYDMFRGVLRAAEGLVVGVRGNEYGPPESNFIHGDESYLEVVWLKVSRLMNLMEVKRQALADGGWQGWSDFDRGRLADSLVDLVNYTAMWAADVALAGQWPKGLQAQPQPYHEAPKAERETMWPEGQEAVQCPRCQGSRDGFFGWREGKWILGCSECGYVRSAEKVGSLLQFYADTMAVRKVTRYGVQGDPTHMVKQTPMKVVPRPDEGPTNEPDTGPMQSTVDALEKVREMAAQVRGAMKTETGAEEDLNLVVRVLEDDPGPDPSDPPAVSKEDAPFETYTCQCGDSLGGFVVAVGDKRKIRLRCLGACGYSRDFPNLTAANRVTGMIKTEAEFKERMRAQAELTEAEAKEAQADTGVAVPARKPPRRRRKPAETEADVPTEG